MNIAALDRQAWGRLSVSRSDCLRPERLSDLVPIMVDAPTSGLLAVGAARSYGDVGLNTGGQALLMERLNRFHSFDEKTGIVVCEPGVTFHDLCSSFLSRGWMAPASPGTGFVTLGGAIANDVHGKNHDSDGSIGQHVVWVELLLPDGDYRRVSRTQDADLFHATIGGLGLTGIICRTALRLLPIPGTQVLVQEERIGNLPDFIAALRAARDTHRFSVGWIDALATGPALGRGVLERANPVDTKAELPALRSRWRMPARTPGWLLNRHSIAAFNALYLRRVPVMGRDRERSLPDFLYPLDAIDAWNRMYGARGFYQFQCVIPDAAADAGLPDLLRLISLRQSASFLAVLKTLGGDGEGVLSFPQRGFTLALDLPNRRDTADLIQELHAITLDHGGRVYLAKDALLTPAHFRQMYPRWEQFAALRERIDPNRRLTSDLAKRLELP